MMEHMIKMKIKVVRDCNSRGAFQKNIFSFFKIFVGNGEMVTHWLVHTDYESYSEDLAFSYRVQRAQTAEAKLMPLTFKWRLGTFQFSSTVKHWVIDNDAHVCRQVYH